MMTVVLVTLQDGADGTTASVSLAVVEVERVSPRPEQRSSYESSSLCREPADVTVGRSRLSRMSTSTYKSLNALMRHMRSSAGIDVRGSAHKRALAHMGYFHGYKGYRFSGSPSRRISYAGFDDLSAVVSFDSGLKAVFYPLLMKLEMTMKNLALVELLEAADSAVLSDVYDRLMPGTKKNGRQGKLEVVHAGNQVLLERHRRGDRIVTHYYDAPGEVVPLWALFEVITLGHFGRLLEQLSSDALVRIANSWGVRRGNADLVPHLVFAITDLRNAVAHNGVVFDTRFANATIRKKVAGMLAREMGFEPALRLGFPKREVYRATTSYASLTDELRSRVPARVFDMIVHTDNRAKVRRLEAWVRAT